MYKGIFDIMWGGVVGEMWGELVVGEEIFDGYVKKDLFYC